MALQIRRGTDAERLAITPLAGELIYTTDTKKLYVGDGVTAGGNQVDTTLSSQYLSVPSNITPDASNTRDIGSSTAKWRTGYFDGLQVDGEITASSFNGNIVDDSSTVIVNASTSSITASTLAGALTGNVSGNVSGDLTGNSTGIHTGTVKADDATVLVDGTTKQVYNGTITLNGDAVTLSSGRKIYFGTSSAPLGVGINIMSTDHANNQAIEIYSDSANNSTVNSNNAYTSRGSIVTPTVVSPDDQLFSYVHYGHDGSGYVRSSFILASVDPTASVGANAVPGKLFLVTTPDNGSTLNFLTINSEGKVGIGVENPSATLDVDGSAKLTSSLIIGNLDQTTINGLTPANGMIVYNTTTNKFQGYENGAWANLI